MAVKPPPTQQPLDDDRVPARHGQLGACIACNKSVQSHFDTEGRFVGCLSPQVDDETVFVLTPVSGRAAKEGARNRRQLQASILAAGAVATLQARQPDSKGRVREFTRARYFPTKAASQTEPKNLNLGESAHRIKVLRPIIAAGDEGALASEIVKRSGLPHGSVQQVLSWLRAHELIEAREDAPEIGKP